MNAITICGLKTRNPRTLRALVALFDAAHKHERRRQLKARQKGKSRSKKRRPPRGDHTICHLKGKI